ncbi:MAG: tRNA preQ1(34) S-adenosylmethionine ribosyltransferase-isomerase QueA [Myxococcales bacterium]|nr:tRNA preQ1(34) S-adenosylmethionine ribosyltransferase-isomerase QueA [Myxococcales bacterium]MCB9552187.1 tRNA preQ1(34) S-adenosylmethionine ribosyltransferase-isomerase QueA [Myxococcales bacterium]
MLRSDFTFDLPDALIAQRPPAVRGESRLMTVPLDGPPAITPFAAIVDRFRGDEVLVLNDTRVVPARVLGHKASGGAVEVFVTEPIGAPAARRVAAMVRGKRLRPGVELVLPGARAVIEARRDDGTVELTLHGIDDLWRWLETAGRVPLPPYIRRDADADDRDRYQTVFAREPGAVAAPTAGLHFTPALLDALRAKGVATHTLTLHVGLGTFLPVRDDDVSGHTMHAERFTVPPATAAAVASGRPVVAVGTTVVRALEAHARDPAADRTDLFILPGFDFRVVDGLLTNFHLPESTLLMLVSAFAGRERIRRAYAEAVAARMRFYSYGDAMLLRREDGRWT